MATEITKEGEICPECKAVNTVVIDTAKGYIVCNNCASVLQMGLEENEQTRYEEDFVGLDVDHARGGASSSFSFGAGGKGNTGGRKKTLNAEDKYKIKAEMVISFFTTMTHVTQNIADAAKTMVGMFYSGSKALNEQTDSPFVLAMACFQIAAGKRNFPIQFVEIADLYQNFCQQGGGERNQPANFPRLTAGILDDLKQKLLTAVSEIKDEAWVQSQKQEVFVYDLANMYITRLGWQLIPTTTLVSHMTLRYADVCRSGFSINSRVAAMCFLCKTNPLMCPALTGEAPIYKSQEQQLFTQLRKATYESASSIQKVLSQVQSKDTVEQLLLGVETKLTGGKKGGVTAGTMPKQQMNVNAVGSGLVGSGQLKRNLFVATVSSSSSFLGVGQKRPRQTSGDQDEDTAERLRQAERRTTS